MHIKKMLGQTRRDFIAIFVCEHCDTEEEKRGYDDDNYHRNVIPRMECKSCGKTADTDTYRPMGTKYPEGQQV